MTKKSEETLTPIQALQKIKSLEYSFIGDRHELHKEINRIISKVELEVNMKMVETIKYEGKQALTTQQLSELFEVEKKTINKNFERNINRYEEGKHYFLLKGYDLKRFKIVTEQNETLKFVPKLYLWTKEGASLLAKSCISNSAWEMLGSTLEEIYNN